MSPKNKFIAFINEISTKPHYESHAWGECNTKCVTSINGSP